MQVPQVDQNLHLKASDFQLQNRKTLLTNDNLIGHQRVRTWTLREQFPEKRRKPTNRKLWGWKAL